ncbi:hypothetical protein Tco_0596945 [Tanacetum coccineum]
MESYSECTQQMSYRKDSSWDTVRLPILQILWGIIHSANLDFVSLIWDKFEWKTVERSSKPSKMSKLLYTRFTKLIIDYLFSLNKSIPLRSNSKLHSLQDDHPITKLLGITNDEYKFGIEIPNAVISDAIKKKAGLDLRKESKSSRLESLRQKKKLVTGEGSSVAHNKYYSSSDTASDATLHSSCLDKSKESANKTNDTDESDMDLSDDNPHGDDAAVRYGVFMHNKSNATPNSTYLGLTVTSSSLDFIQTLLDKTLENELMDFISHLVYTDAQTTSVVHNLEGNPELTSYISGASKVPLGIHVDVLATKTLMQEMFPDENAYHISSPPAKKIPYHTTTPQPSSIQAKAKKLMQKAKKNMRKINFKKAVA